MKIRGQYFDNEDYSLTMQESQRIAMIVAQLLDAGDYTATWGGKIETELTALCEDVYFEVNLPDNELLASRETGIDEIVYLVCAGEGLI